MSNEKRFDKHRKGSGDNNNSHAKSLLRNSDDSANLLKSVESMNSTEIMKPGSEGKTLLNNAITYGDDMVRAHIISKFGINFLVEHRELQNIKNISGPILRTMIEVVLRERAESADSAAKEVYDVIDWPLNL